MHIISSACLHAHMHASMNNKYMWESPLMHAVCACSYMHDYLYTAIEALISSLLDNIIIILLLSICLPWMAILKTVLNIPSNA